ncbi:MAG TPA: type IX secretion system membrane protein PorP/SprF [Tenuifilaceae bacterium]|nr:type IX secretion system membrane protein PorP/SprF [Tenuifilaceae bacterium]HPI45310.1 type IX secretion system membrane protein PorP/SprF [Tenuifilaceae bacterium]HPN21791.1 type IX secretion system membrane protein PorP/SprF [Tenuifilaceae bacterium]
MISIENRKGLPYLLIVVFVMLTAIPAKSQQIPHYTQYMFNTFLTNPAVAGTYKFYQMRLNNRYQWVGFNDAPYTVNMSFFGPFEKRDMGWGVNIGNDATGLTSRTNVMGTYAYNMQLGGSGLRISGGLSFGLLMYRLDGSKATTGEDSYPGFDPAIPTTNTTKITPDGAVGFYLWSSSFNVGFSIQQLFAQRMKFYSSPIEDSKLKQHYMLSGGYWVNLNRYVELETALILKYMIKSPMQAEWNGKLTYRQKTYQMWGGLSVRWKDAVSILVGGTYKNKYSFGYSFDWSLLGISKYNSGSHEIMLGYNFDKIK